MKIHFILCRFQFSTKSKDFFLNYGSPQFGIGLKVKGFDSPEKVMLGDTLARNEPRSRRHKEYCKLPLSIPCSIAYLQTAILQALKDGKKTVAGLVRWVS